MLLVIQQKRRVSLIERDHSSIFIHVAISDTKHRQAGGSENILRQKLSHLGVLQRARNVFCGLRFKTQTQTCDVDLILPFIRRELFQRRGWAVL
jgi:hypothetical protein